MSDFDEYIRQGEPGRSAKAAAWQTAIGLQDVDGLKPSAYLVDTAKRHIEGDITIDQAIADYRRLGYSETWINRRIKSIEIRKGLTDEWKRGGVTKEIDFAFLTDLMSKTWSGMTTREYSRSVVSSEKAIDHIQLPEELPFANPEEQ